MCSGSGGGVSRNKRGRHEQEEKIEVGGWFLSVQENRKCMACLICQAGTRRPRSLTDLLILLLRPGHFCKTDPAIYRCLGRGALGCCIVGIPAGLSPFVQSRDIDFSLNARIGNSIKVSACVCRQCTSRLCREVEGRCRSSGRRTAGLGCR